MSDELSSDTPPEPQAKRDVEGQRIFDRLRNKIFSVDTGPTRIGRWHLLRKLGKGAMGTVYAAYDPELDRHVAIKVLHGMDPAVEEARRLRLRREAQAMARVQHPNLVQVHDVCVDAVQPFVVMELVKGETLRAWQERPERRWRQLVQAYLDAARGLAALHGVEVFHRDFKPDNALVDILGRVRVVDFGLVSATPTPCPPGGLRAFGLTREGALIGTLAYMSPEQLAGGRGDGPSDQFSLCRSLFEAVYRVRPFVGQDPEALLADIRQGVTTPPNPRGAPRRLLTLLRRGLSYEPGHRFASMSALADALAGCLARRVGPLSLTLGGVAALGVVVGVLLSERRPCEDLQSELLGAWDTRQEAAIRDVFLAQRLPDVGSLWNSLNGTMRGVREAWLDERKGSCVARRSSRVPLWAVQRDRCLDDVRSLLRRLSDLYQSPTPADIAGAREAASSLRMRLADCARIDALHPAPSSPELLPRLESAIQQAETEQYAGRLQRAEAAARRGLEIAESSGALAAAAAAHHTLGRVLSHQRRPGEALSLLDAAAREAARATHDTVRIDALLFAAKTRILDLGALGPAARDADDAEDFIVRLDLGGMDTTRQTAELHEVRGFLAEKRRDVKGALEHFGEALRFHRQRIGSTSRTRRPCGDDEPTIEISTNADLDELRTLHNLTRVLDDLGGSTYASCVRALYSELLVLSEVQFGALSPLSLDIRFNFAVHLNTAMLDDEALSVLGPSTQAIRVQYGDRSIAAGDALLLLGVLALEAGDLQTAGRWAHEAAAILAEGCVDHQGCPPNYGGALILQGEHALRSRDPAQAVQFFRTAIDVLTPLEEAEHQLADAMLLLATALADLGDAAEARAWLASANERFRSQGREADAGLLALQARLPTTPPS